METGTDYTELVKDDAIHGRLFYDQSIFDEEMEKIFGRTWIYIGHESEVAEPGDFVGRWMGTQPVVLVRSRDGRLRLFLNRCRHRANTVCMTDRGKAASGFRCIYHGWTYSTNGDLTGVPYPEGFDQRDFRRADYGLIEVPLESYRGFMFGNLNPSEDLNSFLGLAATRLLDQAVDLAPDGEVEVRSSALKHVIRGNWKVSIDNTTDAYHVQLLHQSAFQIGSGRGTNWDSVYGAQGNGRVRDLGHGHAQIDLSAANSKNDGFFVQAFKSSGLPDDRRVYIEAVARRLGEERAREVVAYGDPGPFTLFPTFSYVPPGEVRLIRPVSLFETHVSYFPVLLKGAPDSINAERVRRESFMHGPAGVVTADDIDVFERSQMAFNARKNEWLYLRRGLRSEKREEGGTVVGMAYEETSNRAIWQHYRKIMSA